MTKRLYIFIIATCIPSFPIFGQIDTIRSKKLVPLLIGSGIGYGSALYGLNELWYKQSPRTSFHFFNDLHEWKQVDKVGHYHTAFFESMYAVKILEWSGLERKKAIFWGSISGFILQSPIEILDGFSTSYGASISDIGANALGSILVYSQYALFDEIRIQPKFSFHTTKFPKARPHILGGNMAEQVLKDYNGQTYWLSFNIYSFLCESSKFPKWINLSLGYGAENMVYAYQENNQLHGYNAYRQYYMSVDIDLTKIKSKNKIIKSILYSFNLIHFPAPALELNKFGIKFHPLYY